MSDTTTPIPLNEEQERAAREWAADDRLWTTQDTVEFNLRTFARVILKAQVRSLEAKYETLAKAVSPTNYQVPVEQLVSLAICHREDSEQVDKYSDRVEEIEAKLAALQAHAMPDGLKCRDLGECFSTCEQRETAEAKLAEQVERNARQAVTITEKTDAWREEWTKRQELEAKLAKAEGKLDAAEQHVKIRGEAIQELGAKLAEAEHCYNLIETAHTELLDIEADLRAKLAAAEEREGHMLDALQSAFNEGAFLCPLAGQSEKPERHSEFCQACRVRVWAAGSRYLVTDEEALRRRGDTTRWHKRAEATSPTPDQEIPAEPQS